MTFDQLLYFQTIVELHTFSEAANFLNISQSALSKQIASLEQELGIQLFDRSYRQIKLTKAGSIFLADAKKMLYQYYQMQEHIYTYKQSHESKLKIAMLPILSHYNFAKKIHTFKHLYDNIQIDIHEIEERDITNTLTNQNYDIFILRGNHKIVSSYTKILLYEDTLVAIASKNHPISKKKIISFQELKDEALLLPPPYTKISKIANESCQKHNFIPQIQHYGRIESLIASVREQEGIALLMKQSLSLYNLHNIEILEFDNKIHGDIHMYISPLSKQKNVVKDFLMFLKKES